MCTRATYLGSEGTVITTRTLDWFTPMKTSLWSLPAGLQRNGGTGADTVVWVSRYGSVVLSGYDAATIDGMNERGLAVNMLYLADTDFGALKPGDERPTLCVASWGQYVLDMFATVADAVAALREEPFRILPSMTPDGRAALVHLSIADPSGDSAIFEYLEGELIIHHGRQYQVMTNSPRYEHQLALNTYWSQVDPLVFLPGTNRAEDRFVRASVYLGIAQKFVDESRALAAAFSVIRNASVPIGVSDPERPNISATQWRCVSDHKQLQYYFESCESPYLVWVRLNDVDLRESASPRWFEFKEGAAAIGSDGYIAGDISSYLVPAEPREFLYLPSA